MAKDKVFFTLCKYLGQINGNMWRSLASVFKKCRIPARRNHEKMALEPFGSNYLPSVIQQAMQKPVMVPFLFRVFPRLDANLEPNWGVMANAFVALPSTPSRRFLLPKPRSGSKPRMTSTSGSSRMKNSMIQNNSGMVITLDTSGFTRENITVEVEGKWLVVEALATSAQPGKGGYLQRHMMRRFELLPQSDVSSIKIEMNQRTNQLIVTVPQKKPQVTI